MLGGNENMEQPESSDAAERASGSLKRMLRPPLMDCAELQRRRNILGGAYLEKSGCSDSLAVALQYYFEGHIEHEDIGEDEHGNDLWASQKVDEALDRIANVVWPNDKLCEDAGK